LKLTSIDAALAVTVTIGAHARGTQVPSQTRNRSRPNPERMGAFHEDALSLKDAKVARNERERGCDFTTCVPELIGGWALDKGEHDE